MSRTPTDPAGDRPLGVFLVVVAVWNAVTWTTFAKNLAAAKASGEERATGYWVAHSVLTVVNLLLGGVFAALGLRRLRGAR